jgi:hypothetical protein
MTTHSDPPDARDGRVEFTIPSNLSPTGRQEFVNRVLAYACDLRDELEQEPTFEGLRGRAEVSRAASRLPVPRLGSPDGSQISRGEGQSQDGSPSLRKAGVAATVSLAGYLIPYLGLSAVYVVAYALLQIGLAVMIFGRLKH